MSIGFWVSALVMIVSARAADPKVIFVMGGDVQWSLTLRPPSVKFDAPDAGDPDWRASPRVTLKQNKPDHDAYAIRYKLQFDSPGEMLHYPLLRLAPTLRAADLVFFNLETPLSDTARMDGEARTPSGFAAALRDSGASVVTLGNNHTFDTQAAGFLDTMRSLTDAGLPFVGGGHDLAEARRAVILERNGIRIGFLGYAQFSNMGEPAFAAAGRPGIAPMDPALMEDDIRRLRGQVDLVAVSVHWGTDKSARVSPANRRLAHSMIDWGADLVLGHHTPIPKGIEVYNGKVIVYSPSHVAIGHNHPDWGDNYLVRFELLRQGAEKIEILPIAGQGAELGQPFLLSGDRARTLLEAVRTRSGELGTAMTVEGDAGVIRVRR